MHPDVVALLVALPGFVAIGLVWVFKRGAKSYVDEKAKNLATIQDTAKITEEVEAVKAQYSRHSHAWKWVFEKEYELLEQVWRATWDLQAAARSLRPLLDRLPKDAAEERGVFQERYSHYGETVASFREAVFKNEPFIPPTVYQACLNLRQHAVNLQVDFEMSAESGAPPDWMRKKETVDNLDAELEVLKLAIRNHVHVAK